MASPEVTLPFVVGLCPTYLRPRLLENAIACWLAQDYPAERRWLLVLDDAGQIAPQVGDGWTVCSVPLRYSSLPAKFNALLDMAVHADVVAVVEDDDVLLPHAVSSAVRAMTEQAKPWSKPSSVLKLVPDKPTLERAAFHASLVMRRDWLLAQGGWVPTKRADFDQQLMAKLIAASPPADPCEYGQPGYVYRWTSTGAWHGQNFMRTPDDETWYDRVPVARVERVDQLVPHMDSETLRVYEWARTGNW